MNLLVVCTNYPIVKGNAEYNLLKIQINSLERSFKKIFLLPTGRIKFQSDYPNLEDTIFHNLRSPNGIIIFGF